MCLKSIKLKCAKISSNFKPRLGLGDYKLKVKGGDIVLNGMHLSRATERHLPYGITTQHRWTRPALTPARQAGTRLTYPIGMEGW